MAKPLIKRLQRDILKRHIGPFLFCFLIVMFLLLMQFLILHIENLVGKGIPFVVILELIATNLAYMVVLAVPMSVLVACLMAFGKFSELNELTAIKAAGINPLQIVKPVFIVAAGLSVFLVWFSNEVLPEANYKARSLFIDIRLQKPGFDLRPNVFYDGIENYNFLVRHIEADSDSLYDVTLFQEAAQGREPAVIKAERGFLTSVENTDILSLFLYDGTVHRTLTETVDGKPRVEKTSFSTYRINFDLSELSFSRTDHTRRRRDDRTMSSQAMLAVIDSLNQNTQKDWVQYTGKNGVNTILAYPAQQLLGLPESEVFPQPIPVDPIVYFDGDEPKVHAPVETRYHTLNRFETMADQREAARETIVAMRNSVAQYSALQNNINWRAERIAQYMVEVHKKVSIPVACMIFVLVGAPLGMLTRKGNLGFNALICTIIFTYYWIGVIQGEKLADRMVISPFTGMWFANITLIVFGTYLTLKVMYEFRFSDLWRKRHES